MQKDDNHLYKKLDDKMIENLSGSDIEYRQNAEKERNQFLMQALCEACPVSDNCDGWEFAPHCMTGTLNVLRGEKQ